MNRQSNDDLARQISNKSATPTPKASHPPASLPAPNEKDDVFGFSRQRWTLGERKTGLEPLSEREVRALFSALSKGTKLALGREPTVAELVCLKNQVNDARALVASVEATLLGNLNVRLEEGQPVFTDPAQAPRT